MTNLRETEIIEIIKSRVECSSKEVFDNITLELSYATLKRILSKLVSENFIRTKGKGKGTKYLISPVYELIQPVDIEHYFKKEIDEREIKEGFNFEIITEVLEKHSVFTKNEQEKLSILHKNYKSNISQLQVLSIKRNLKD